MFAMHGSGKPCQFVIAARDLIWFMPIAFILMDFFINHNYKHLKIIHISFIKPMTKILSMLQYDDF